MSRYLDKNLTVNVVPGEVEGDAGHLITMWNIPDTEYANTPPRDLWYFFITKYLYALAHAVNKLGDVRTKSLPLPPKNASVVGFLSSDGKIPVRLLIGRRPAEGDLPARHLFVLDLYAMGV
jgi:hypothetical protein